MRYSYLYFSVNSTLAYWTEINCFFVIIKATVHIVFHKGNFDEGDLFSKQNVLFENPLKVFKMTGFMSKYTQCIWFHMNCVCVSKSDAKDK